MERDLRAPVARATVLRGLSSAQPWADQLAVEEIQVDGTTVIARLALRDAHPQIAYNLLFNQESLVTHG